MKKPLLSIFNQRVFGLAKWGVLMALLMAMSLDLAAQSDGLPRGAYQMPYTRYEAESANRNPSAVLYQALDFDQTKIASEASNQQYVGLPTNGAYVAWNATQSGRGVTMRFTMPDNETTGEGRTGSLDVYVNGSIAKTVNLTSRYAWQYFKTGVDKCEQIKAGSDKTLMRFDEVHFTLTNDIMPGQEIRIQKSNGDALEYGVDFIEIEPIPVAKPAPANSLSVVDFGANGNDTADDLAAFHACLAAAQSQGKNVYIPAGKFYLSAKLNFNVQNLTFQGAGIWYTELFFSTDLQFSGGIYARASNVVISDFFLHTVNNDRWNYDEPFPLGSIGEYKTYKGFMGTYGSNSTISNVWVEHFECGAWVAGYDAPLPVDITSHLTMTKMRIRNNYADGVNFCQGTNNSIVEHSNIRNSGDDGLAVWPNNAIGVNTPASNNSFRYNTIENQWRAGGTALFGASGHSVHHSIYKDGIASSAIRLTTDFSGYKFDINTGINIYENTIIRFGTSDDLWNCERGSIEMDATNGSIKNITFSNIDIFDAQRHGIQFGSGGGYENVVLNNISINGTGLDNQTQSCFAIPTGGAAVFAYATSGGAIFNNLAYSNVEYSTPVYKTSQAFNLVLNNTGPIAVTSVSLPTGPINLLVGQSVDLIPNFVPSNASNKIVGWTSSNASIATVDANTQRLTGNATGTTVITVTTQDGNKTAQVTVNVTAAVNLTSPDATVAESGDTGSFTISIANLAQTITVGYTLSGTAISGTDYTGNPALTGSITLSPSTLSRNIVISAIDDSNFEGAENITMTLQAGSGYVLGGNVAATISIADNENPPCTSPVIGLTATAPGNNNTIEAVWNDVPSRTINNTTVGTKAGDYTGKWRAMYDTQKLYVLVEVGDATLTNDSGTEWWNDDVVNIFIDGNNSKGTSYDGINDFQLGFRWNDVAMKVGGNSVQNPAGITFNTFPISGGYAVKVAIPLSTIGASATIGYTIGFDVAVDDDDNGGTRDAQVSSFATTEMGWANPSLFGSVYMTTCAAIVPTIPVITSPLAITRNSGDAINYSILASNFPTSYSASNLPSGITLNTSTGVLSGNLNAVGTFNATIRAINSAGTDAKTLVVTVNAVNATGVTVTPATANIQTGGTQQLTATVAPANATNKNVNWTSSNASVATVNNGLVTAVAAGTATITATTAQGGFTASSVITVTTPGSLPPVSNPGAAQTITLPINSVVLNGSGSSDPDGTISSYVWAQTSGPNTATLSGQNTVQVTASNLVVGQYTFTLTVRDNNNNATSASVIVTVNPVSTIPADRGYYDAPYTRYEATANNIGGGATYLAKTWNQKLVHFEASDRQCASLNANGSNVSFTLSKAGRGIVMRFSIPDAPGGGGITGKLALYVGTSKIQDINLNSKWAWQYFSPSPTDGTKDPTNGPATGWTARMAFDEVRVLLPNELPIGSVIRIQKESGDAINYLVDFIEVEPVAAPLPQPANTISMGDYGIPNDGIDDKSAFDQAYTAARQQGKGIYWPAGKWDLSAQFYLYTNNLTFTGAGMWHTELYFSNEGPGNGGFNPNATNLTFADFSMTTANAIRALPYKGFVGNYGTGSTISNVWVEHFEVGAWIANFHGNTGNQDLEIVNCRFRNNYADGVNFSKGTSNSICHHSSFRNNGDDAMASWSSIDGPMCLNNEFAYCTAENTWRAAGVGFFGGGGHKAHHILVKDCTEAGLRINSDFQGHPFSGDPINFYEITVIGSGTNANLWYNRYGAIDIFTRLYNMSNVTFDKIDVLDSQKDAIFVYTVNPQYTISNLTLSNITINGTGLDGNINNYTAGTWDDYAGYGVLTDGQVKATLNMCNVTYQNIASADMLMENPANITLNTCNSVPATGITLSAATLSVNVGSTGTLTATVLPANASNKSVTWSTSNASVATVSNGVVTGVANGTAVITGTTHNGLTATANVTVTTVNIPVTGVSVSPTTASRQVGQTQQLTATVLPANATNKNVTWSTSNATVATVNPSGLVTAMAAGTATITVTTVVGNFTATSIITVTAAPVQSPFSGSPISLPGTVEIENYDLGGQGVAYHDVDANNAGGQGRTTEGVDLENCSAGGLNVGWTSAGEWMEYTVNVGTAGTYNFEFRVASINAGGTFHVEFDGVNKTGTVTGSNTGAWQTWTSVFANNISLSAGVQIMRVALDNPNHNIDKVIITSNSIIPVTSVSVSPTTFSRSTGTTQQLTATVLPANATNKTVSWTTSNASVATVNQSGLVTAVGAGSALITVTTQNGGFTATSTATVTTTIVPVTGVSVSPATVSIAAGATSQLTATVAPSNATNKNVTWSTSNAAVATVNGGLVSGVAAGTATITVTTQDGGFTATRTVTVTGAQVAGYRIRNRWQNTYLTDGGANVTYAATASGNNFVWILEDVGGGNVEIKNAGTGEYMHIENLTGSIQCTARTFGWYSSRWAFETVDATYRRVRNAWQTNNYIHVENLTGSAQRGTINTAWQSAQWAFEAVGGAREIEMASTDAMSNYEVSVYPNPVSGSGITLTVSEMSQNGFNVEIIDFTGRMVFANHFEMNKVEISTDRFSSGVYLVRILNGSKISNNKLIVK